MTLQDVPILFILAGLVAYVVLAGPDFGAAIWQVTAKRDDDGEHLRDLAHDAMAPVWEANHVWLIFVLTVMWTSYPTAFGSIASTLCVALFVAGLGIVVRGAAYALFVDDGVQARALLRDNTETLGLGGVTRIFRRDATKLGPVHPLEPFTLAFLDPPYAKGLAEKALASARDGGWLVPGALVVVEEAADAGFKASEGFEELERRAYDDTELIFLRTS